MLNRLFAFAVALASPAIVLADIIPVVAGGFNSHSNSPANYTTLPPASSSVNAFFSATPSCPSGPLFLLCYYDDNLDSPDPHVWELEFVNPGAGVVAIPMSIAAPGNPPGAFFGTLVLGAASSATLTLSYQGNRPSFGIRTDISLSPFWRRASQGRRQPSTSRPRFRSGRAVHPWAHRRPPPSPARPTTPGFQETPLSKRPSTFAPDFTFLNPPAFC